MTTPGQVPTPVTPPVGTPAPYQPAVPPAGPQAPPAPLQGTGPAPTNQDQFGSMPWYVAMVVLLWLAVLVAAVPLYHDVTAIRSNIPLQAGPIPLGVMWWGALGGVTVSLVGIGRYWKSWDSSFTLWHTLRPIVGAIVGSVSYLIFITVIRSTGTTPSTTGIDSRVVYFLVAFITGFQEQTFRNLISRATQVLMGPGDDTSGNATAGNNPGTTPPHN